jgi:hypothetical protein
MNSKIITIKGLVALLCLAMALTACKKKPEGEITVTTRPVTNITETSARGGGNVSYTGAFTIGSCGICYGEAPNPTVYDVYTDDSYGTGDFVSEISNLRPNTKYYVRAYSNTSSGLIYGNEESFTTTKGTWLYYGSSYNNRWGLYDGGTLTWAVMYPSEIMSDYAGMKISKVMVHVGKSGTFTLDIYEGGDDAPSNRVLSKNCTFSYEGEKNVTIDEINVNPFKNLWVAFTNTHNAEQYPAGSSAGKNNPNARWRSVNGLWLNTLGNGWKDLCWCIKVYVTDEAKGEEYEIVFP